MIQLFILFTLAITTLSSGVKESDIRSKESELNMQNIESKKIDRKLSQIADDILKVKRELRTLSKKLATLESRIAKSEKSYERLSSKKLEVDRELERLSKEIEKKQEKFISLIADNLV